MRRKIGLACVLLFMASLVFSEVLLLKDGTIIRGKIIKLDEDKVVILSTYGELLVDRDQIIKTYFNDAEYEREVEAAKTVKPVVEEPKIVERIVERIVEIVKPVVVEEQKELIEDILFDGIKTGMDFKAVHEIMLKKKRNIEFDRKKGIISVYYKKKDVEGLHESSSVYIQYVFTEDTLTDMFYYIIDTEDATATGNDLGKLISLTFETGGKGVKSAYGDNAIDVYFSELNLNKDKGICIHLHAGDVMNDERQLPGTGFEALVGFGFTHSGLFGVQTSMSGPNETPGFCPYLTMNFGLSLPLEFMAVLPVASVGLYYSITTGYGMLYLSPLAASLNIDNRLLLSIKSGGLFSSHMFVFRAGVNWGYLFGHFGGRIPTGLWHVGPSLYWGSETRGKAKKNFAFGWGIFLEGRFSRVQFEYVHKEDYSPYKEISRQWYEGPFAVASVGLQFNWQGVARKVFYK